MTSKATPKGRARDSLELPRRALHSSIGLLVVVLYWLQADASLVSKLLLPVTVGYGVFEWYRLHKSSPANNAFVKSMERFLRKEENEKFTSAFYYILGAQLTLLLFSRPVAALSLLYLAWCDPISGIAGRLYGPTETKAKAGRFWNGKSHAGACAAVVLGTLITLVFLLCSTRPIDGLVLYAVRLVSTSVLGGLFAATGEVVNLGTWDDNFTMPLISATLLSLFSPISALYANEI